MIGAMPKNPGSNRIAPTNMPITVRQSANRTLLIGIQTATSTPKLTIPPAIRCIVDKINSDNENHSPTNVIATRLPTIQIAAGKETRKTFRRNPFGIVSS